MYKNTSILLLISIAIISGIFLGEGNFFQMIKLFSTFFIVLFLSSLGLIIGSFVSNTSLKKGIIFLFVCSISTFISFTIKLNIKQDRAKQIIHELEEYKSKFGKYPKNLRNIIKEHSLKKYHYSTNQIQNTFTLSFSLDGWHHKEYASTTKLWVITD